MNKTIALKALPSALMSLVLLLGAASVSVNAHEGTRHSRTNDTISSEEHAFGKQGNPRKVDRTMTVDMTDNMRFIPGDITVRQGETVRFVVVNKGKIMHEMVIGTIDELKEHGEMMKKHPGMEHDEPYMSHVSPGKKEDLVWQFTQPGEFYYACLIPGHFEAGMMGKITVMKDSRR